MAADEIVLRDEDRLPWLETVEADEPESTNIGRIVIAVIVGLALVAAAAFAFSALSGPATSVGDGSLIVAPQGDYKIRPEDPGGLKVKGEGESAIATSAGTAGNGAIDLTAVPEAPIAGRRAAASAAVAGDAKAVAAVPASSGRLAAAPPMGAPRNIVPGAASGGTVVQLGAYPSAAIADESWGALATRFGYLAILEKQVIPAEVGGRTVYRLRVNAGSADAAADLCGRLKVAGERCSVTS